MKGQKKTQDEKIEIFKNYLTNGLSYKDTAEKYQISYNNVYTWAQKYKQHGQEGLVDWGGRGKPNTIQTSKEKLRAEIVAIKARNEYLEVERELMSRQPGLKPNIKPSSVYKKKGPKISHLCDALGISRSGYYKWLNRIPTASNER